MAEKKDFMDAIVDELIAKAKESDDGIEDLAETISDYLEDSEEFQKKLIDRVLADKELKEKVMPEVMDEILD